ncbi:MAG: hypothetical protein COV52_06055 [Gammaproteobacteria bacterium CG11_big_fil_rev_8_21_14_0_20_46_22]|nr:MAG: hypothetical protein COW05_07605 [Gammaproteobacteria bacterium CG12_big_fil_rev_8_21_14_0_65_46_12]PIR11065.1 MAG: hypothetical protein COV52_06055 [Gammaproteobacteria bacterium CG11_big_fil_rev_8_21_14_0_20_46_22]
MTSVKPFQAELKQTFSMAMPLVASSLVQSASGFVGTVIVAHLGKIALAASALVGMSWVTLLVLVFGMLNSISVLVAQRVGAKQYGEASRLGAQGMIVAVLLAIPVMVVMYFENYLFIWTKQPASILAYATPYLHALSWCMLPLAILIVMEQFLIGIGKTQLVMWISLLQVPFEMLFNYAFTFGKFGLPAFGIAGVGYGFTTVFIIAMVLIALYITYSDVGRQYPLFKSLRGLHLKVVKKIFQIGWPIGLMYGSEVGYFAIITFFMGHFGLDTLAAHQITFQYLALLMAVVFGISQAVSARVGHAVGRNDRSSIRLAMHAGFVLAVGGMFIVALAYWFAPRLLISVDQTRSLSLNAIQIAVLFLAIAAVFQLFDALRLVAVGALRGLNDTRAPLWISLVAFSGLGLLSGYVFAYHWHLGGAGFWLGMIVGDVACALILIYRFGRQWSSVDLASLMNTD